MPSSVRSSKTIRAASGSPLLRGFTFKDGKFDAYGKKNNIEGAIIYEDSRGTLFFPTREFLTIKKGDTIEKIPFQNGGVQSVKEDREGGIWLGTVNGLSRLKDGVLVNGSGVANKQW